MRLFVRFRSYSKYRRANRVCINFFLTVYTESESDCCSLATSSSSPVVIQEESSSYQISNGNQPRYALSIIQNLTDIIESLNRVPSPGRFSLLQFRWDAMDHTTSARNELWEIYRESIQNQLPTVTFDTTTFSPSAVDLAELVFTGIPGRLIIIRATIGGVLSRLENLWVVGSMFEINSRMRVHNWLEEAMNELTRLAAE